MPRLIKLLLGGAIIALALKNKDKVAGLIGGGQQSDTASPAPTYSPPPASPVANADVAGPPENTSTSVPAPEPVVQPSGIDEEAEIQAAAAEAANIGGGQPDYPDLEGEDIAPDPADIPVEEAGGGVAEGQEIAEADLADNAEPAAGDPIEGERAIEEAIEAQADPTAGETVEPLDPPPPTGDPVDLDPPPLPAEPADDKSTTIWRNEEQPTVESPAVKEDEQS